MALLILSFVAGVLTVLAPCVLPLLPVIIGGAASGSEKDSKRPYIIAASLAVSLILFTLLLKVSASLATIPPQVWMIVSGGIIFILGVITVFPSLWEQISAKLHLQSGSNKILTTGMKHHNTFLGAVIIGAALGPVFSSCSPTYAFILASILPANFAQGFVYLIFYTLGLVLFLLLLSIFGRRLISKFGWAVNPHGWFRRILGIIFVVLGLAIMTGTELKFETWLANNSPFDITKVEQKAFDQAVSPGASVIMPTNKDGSSVLNTKATNAPELTGLGAWINSDPTTLAALKGKVVLIDFWTYSCINCIRTLPYVEKWYETYKDQGFVVLGIHTPEFAFEHEVTNVKNAAKEHDLTYPIALDNSYSTWNAYDNHYWPAHYLIDKDGKVRYIHFGEGEYATTEKAIQELLGEDKPLVTSDSEVSRNNSQTPETYFGTARAKNFVGKPVLAPGIQKFEKASSLDADMWTLGGTWDVQDDTITSADDAATIAFHVAAKNVYMVASSSDGVGEVKISSDSKNSWQGKDVLTNGVMVKESKLYHIAQFEKFQDAVLELRVPKGVSLYTFTFGD
jgi:cytochrome c biogenesis protein CcdA/thiol-disulfide isomerase/thioredoxin